MRRLILIPFLLAAAIPAAAQMPDPLAKSKPQAISPITQPGLPPGVIELMELDGRFAQETEKGGGAAFVSWFADDALTLNNKLPPVVGKARIGDTANWKPQEYKLTWYPLGGQMGPSNDMGYTWGHYETHSKDREGKPVTTSGRYITIWKKLPSGIWKVAMDASAEEPPNPGDCCALPKP